MTLVVSGPPAIQLLIPRGQTVDHGGRRTVCALTVTPEEELEVAGVLRTIGLDVAVHGVDPDEGSDERTDLHIAPAGGVGKLPTIACPTCAWLDYGPGGFACGVEVWHPEAARAFDHGRAADDLAACPARRTVIRRDPAAR